MKDGRNIEKPIYWHKKVTNNFNMDWDVKNKDQYISLAWAHIEHFSSEFVVRYAISRIQEFEFILLDFFKSLNKKGLEL